MHGMFARKVVTTKLCTNLCWRNNQREHWMYALRVLDVLDGDG